MMLLVVLGALQVDGPGAPRLPLGGEMGQGDSCGFLGSASPTLLDISVAPGSNLAMIAVQILDLCTLLPSFRTQQFSTVIPVTSNLAQELRS